MTTEHTKYRAYLAVANLAHPMREAFREAKKRVDVSFVQR